MFQLPSLYLGVHKISYNLADLVGDLQKFLLGREFRVSVDEEFGPQTESAVKLYQRTKGIDGDGRVGPRTWGFLLSDGFRPKDFVTDSGGYDARSDPNFPVKPPGATSPNGLLLFGRGFKYEPKPLPSMPEHVVADQAWVRANIGTAYIHELVGVRGAPLDGGVLVNRQLIHQVEAVFSLWDRLGLLDRIETFGGSYVPRFIRGRSDKLSNHSFGSAFDINAAWNPFRTEPALFGQRGCVRELVLPAYKLGFYWGGWYNDGMHFEAFKALGPLEIGKAVEQILESV